MNGHAHIDFDTLSDYVDGVLPHEIASNVGRHLAVCESCSAEHGALRHMLQSMAELPKSVLPEDDLWPDLERALNVRKVVALRSTAEVADAASAASRRASPWRPRLWLAAAAVVLVLASSAITALVLRRSDATRTVVQTPDTVRGRRAVEPPRVALLASFEQTEKEYNRTIEELQLAVNTQRSRLSPETIRTVDHSLAVVDSAIAEARAALLADPNNSMLVDLLSASYERKLELLRRTSELGSRT